MRYVWYFVLEVYYSEELEDDCDYIAESDHYQEMQAGDCEDGNYDFLEDDACDGNDHVLEDDGCHVLDDDGCHVLKDDGCHVLENDGCYVLEDDGCHVLEDDAYDGTFSGQDGGDDGVACTYAFYDDGHGEYGDGIL